MLIEPAKLTDIANLTTLYQALTLEMHQLQPTNYQQNYAPDFYTWAQMIDDPLQLLLVSRQSTDNLAGFCHVTTARTSTSELFIPHHFAYVTALYVSPTVRRQHLATHFLQQARDWQHAQHLEYLELTVLGNNQAAHALYQQLGYVTQNQTLRLN